MVYTSDLGTWTGQTHQSQVVEDSRATNENSIVSILEELSNNGRVQNFPLQRTPCQCFVCISQYNV